MQFGTVTGRFLSADGDPLSGVVRFTPEVASVVVSGAGGGIVLPSYIEGVLDPTGQLCDPDTLTDGAGQPSANPGIRLVVPEPGATYPESWGYEVRFFIRSRTQVVPVRLPNVTVTTAGLDLASLLAPTVPTPTPTGPTEPASITVTETAPGTYELSGATVTETTSGTYELTGATVTESDSGLYTIGA